MKARGRHQTFRAGSTLVEIVIFMALALMVLGSTFPLLSMIMASDKATEEDLGSFVFIQGAKERLRATPYAALTDGFTEKSTSSGTVYYEKNTTSTNFYKSISGRFRERLYPKSSTEVGTYYQARFELWWSTQINGLSKKTHYKRVDAPLLPDI